MSKPIHDILSIRRMIKQLAFYTPSILQQLTVNNAPKSQNMHSQLKLLNLDL